MGKLLSAYKFPDFPLDYFLVQCYNFLGHGLRLLSNVCLATSFYQMTLTLSLVFGEGLFSFLLFWNLRNLLYLIETLFVF